MNARTCFTPSPAAYRELAVSDHCKNVEAFAEFISLCSGDREMSAYFGPISTRDLVVEVLLDPRAKDEQLAAGMKELRNRFIEDGAEAIADRILKLERDVEEDA